MKMRKNNKSNSSNSRRKWKRNKMKTLKTLKREVIKCQTQTLKMNLTMNMVGIVTKYFKDEDDQEIEKL
jgi:hypothetical protein